MLKGDTQFWWELYKSAVRKRDRRLSSIDKAIERYCGPAWMSDSYGGEIENPEFEMVAQVGPKIVWDNPRVRITTARPGAAQSVARAMHTGLNRNIQATCLRKEAKRVLIDTLFRWGVMLTELESLSDYGPVQGVPDDGIPMRPRSRRVSFRRYFEDPTATCAREIRFRGHESIYVIDDLLEHAEAHPDEGWDMSVLRSLKGDPDLGGVYRPEKEDSEAPKRGEIAVVEMYVEGYQIEGEPGPELGFNGAWMTFLVTGADDSGNEKAEELRPPYMAFVPKGGPYVVFGEYIVPDNESPLAALEAGSAVLEERAAHQKALARAAARRKQIVLLDGISDTANEDIINAIDGDALVVPGLDTQHALPLELGGITETAVAYKQYLDAKADRLLGADDANVGAVKGKATATENAIAADSTNVRQGGRQRTFNDFMSDVLTIEAWYLYHLDKIAFPLPPEAAQLAGLVPGVEQSADGAVATPPDPWFHGGNVQKGSGFTFDDLELVIEPYSMTRTSPEVQAATGAFLAGPFFEVVQGLVMNPAVPPDKFMQALSDAFNNPTYVDLVDPKLIRLQQGLGLMAQMPMGQQPALAGDVGANGPSGVTQMRTPLGPPGAGAPQLGGRPGAFGSKPEKTGTQRIGMKPAGPASRQSKPKAKVGAA